MTGGRYCPRCGSEVAEEFCPRCGAHLGQAGLRRGLWLGLGLAGLVVGGGCTVMGLTLMAEGERFAYFLWTSAVLGLGVLGGFAPTLLYGGLVLAADPYEREPGWALIGSLLWGALVAGVVAFLVDSALFIFVLKPWLGQELAERLVSVALAPLVEETVKGAFLLGLFSFYRQEFDNILDGIVYGAMVGLGFGAIENAEYFVQAARQPERLVHFLLTHNVLSPNQPGHALFTALTGAGLGLAREADSAAVRLAAPVLGWSGAVTAHAFWNGVIVEAVGPTIASHLRGPAYWPASLLVSAAYHLPLVATLAVLGILSLRRQARLIREELCPEVAAGTLRPEEYERLSSLRLRLGAEWSALRRKGLSGWRATAEFHQAATELAFLKWRLGRGEHPRGSPGRTPADAYRRQIAWLRERMGP
jgi:RsiW-degrading membrane proteinase PrsW (M82 family)